MNDANIDINNNNSNAETNIVNNENNGVINPSKAVEKPINAFVNNSVNNEITTNNNVVNMVNAVEKPINSIGNNNAMNNLVEPMKKNIDIVNKTTNQITSNINSNNIMNNVNNRVAPTSNMTNNINKTTTQTAPVTNINNNINNLNNSVGLAPNTINNTNNEINMVNAVEKPINSYLNNDVLPTATVTSNMITPSVTGNQQPAPNMVNNMNNQNVVNSNPVFVQPYESNLGINQINNNNGYVSLDTRNSDMNQLVNDHVKNDTIETTSDEDDVEYLDYSNGLANVFKRIFADILDNLVVVISVCASYIALSTIFIFVNNAVLELIVLIITIIALSIGNLVYRTVNEGKGSSIGRKVTNTVVLNDMDNNISIVVSLLRTLISNIINATGIGFIVNVVLMCTNKDKKAIEDMIFKTKVVDIS